MASKTARTANGGTRIGGQYGDILWSFFVMALLLMVFSAVLLGMVIAYRVPLNASEFPRLRLRSESSSGNGVIYVDLNATFLIFIASWSSTLAPSLAGFAVALASYPAARRYLQTVRQGDARRLLTPYQLGLTLRFHSGGGIGALWAWLRYLVGWNSTRKKQAGPLRTAASVFCSALSLSLLVIAADTWLHISTKTVNFTRVTPGRRQGSNFADRFGYGMRPQCTISNNSYSAQGGIEDPCSLRIGTKFAYMVNPDESMKVLNNVSDNTFVQTISGSAVRTIKAGDIGDRNTPYTFLTPQLSEGLARTDYTADTIAMQTHCRPITRECNLTALAGLSAPFNCRPLLPAFAGDLQVSKWKVVSFNDETGTNNYTIAGVLNPFYFGIAALVNEQGAGVPRDDDGWITPRDGRAFILLCNATVFTARHTSVNGSRVGAGALHRVAPANVSVANIVHGVAEFSKPGDTALRQAATVAALRNASQQMADDVALAFSRLALGGASGAFEQRPVLEAQYRSATLVARVPVAPLTALLAANLLLALLGAGLTLVALAAVAGRGSEETAEVQARLSIAGVVADRFEGVRAWQPVPTVEDMFDEKKREGVEVRAGIDRSVEYGGWAYKVWQSGPATLLHRS